RFDTDRQKKMTELAMAFKKISMEEARAEVAESIAAKRMGDPSEFGDACAFLCSAQAGFISGQNLQLDGGTYHGLICGNRPWKRLSTRFSFPGCFSPSSP